MAERASIEDSNFRLAWLNLGFAGISNFNREPWHACHAIHGPESTAINFFLFISYYISFTLLIESGRPPQRIPNDVLASAAKTATSFGAIESSTPRETDVVGLRLPQRILYFVMLCAPRAEK